MSLVTAQIQLTPYRIFADAALFPKLILVTLAVLAIAAVAVCARKLTSGPRLAGGSAFLSSLRLGAPLLGLLGATHGFMNMWIGIAGTAGVSAPIIAPGVVEAVFVIFVGLLVGVIAVICHWAVEARIDRTVLKG